MADLGIIQPSVAYRKNLLIEEANGSKIFMLYDPNLFGYETHAKKTIIREITTTGAGDYVDGWNNGLDFGSCKQVEYWAAFDRQFVAVIDSMREIQSYNAGGIPTISGVVNSFYKTGIIPEMDMAMFARLAAQVPAENTHVVTDSGYACDAANIIDTITNINANITNSGDDNMVYMFMSASTVANLQKALLAKNILMSDEVVSRVVSKAPVVDFDEIDVDQYDEETVEFIKKAMGNLSLDFRVYKLNKNYIIEVPDKRFVNKVLMLNKINPGQELGGCIPQLNSSAFAEIKIFAIPRGAAYFDVQHIVSEMFIPMNAEVDSVEMFESIKYVNERFAGLLQLPVQAAGIHQKGDSYKFTTRVCYGGDLLNIRKQNVQIVLGTAGAVASTPKKATCVSPASALSGAKTTTSDIKFVFEDINCSGTVYFVSKTTGSATVDASETLTVPTSGEDLRPWASPTVTFGNTAGTSVIEVHTGSASGPKIGEITVTSEG